MGEEDDKRVALVSEDAMTVKLINYAFANYKISIDPFLTVEKLGNMEEDEEDFPSAIIYDCPSRILDESLLCRPLKDCGLQENTPVLIISTLKKNCASCPEYEAGRCAHIQKPFKIKDMTAKLIALVEYQKSSI